tara:strand:- start:257 stop:643 length:387 start_codon:yes stop_codon:yes gene_type:complete
MITKSQVETRSSIIEQYDDEILKIARKQGVEMEIEDLDEIASVYKELLQNKQPKLLVILDEECNSDMSFMEKMGNSERQLLKKAEALVVSSLGKRLEANFYIRRYKPNYPVAVFNNEEEGLAWLQSID